MPGLCLFSHAVLNYIFECYRNTCRREMSLIGSTSFGFAQNKIHDFQNTVLNLYWHCLRQMPQNPENDTKYYGKIGNVKKKTRSDMENLFTF